MKHIDLENYAKGAIVEETMALNKLTLTGTGGTANITAGGYTALASYGTSLTATAAAFVVSHSEEYLKRGIIVEAAAGVLTFTRVVGQVEVSIANVTTNLSGTLTSVYTPDLRAGVVFRLTSQANFTIAALKNARDVSVQFEIKAGGAHTVTWDTSYQFTGGTEHTQTSSGRDIISGYHNATTGYTYLPYVSKDIKA